MKKSFSRERILLVACVTLMIVGGLRWQQWGRQPAPAIVKAAAQAIQYQFTNDYLKLGADAKPVAWVEVVLQRQRLAVNTPLVGDLTTLDDAALTVKNTSGQAIKQVSLRLTAYGLDGQQAAVIPGHPLGKLGAKQTESFPLVSLARALQSKAAQLAKTIERVEVKLEYVEFADHQLWRYGLMHSPFDGFKGRTWIVKGREASTEQQLRAYRKATGEETPKVTEVQQFFKQRSARTKSAFSAPEYDSTQCMNYAGFAIFDCGPNDYSGCETGTDYGNYIPPLQHKFYNDSTYCFPWSYPYPSNCWTLSVLVTWMTSETCF